MNEVNALEGERKEAIDIKYASGTRIITLYSHNKSLPEIISLDGNGHYCDVTPKRRWKTFSEMLSTNEQVCINRKSKNNILVTINNISVYFNRDGVVSGDCEDLGDYLDFTTIITKGE